MKSSIEMIKLVNIKKVAGILGVIGILLGSGCAGREINEDDPKSIFDGAEEDIESDRYEFALEKLRMVKNRFPYSNYSQKAHLRIADVYFLQELFTEAASAYELFKDLHPRHEKVPYAMYRMGESHYQEIPDNIARDLTSAYSALDAFNQFLKRFAAHKNTNEAKKRVKAIRMTLAEKQLYIASFYMREDKYSSAKSRYEKLIQLYPETTHAKEARGKLKAVKKLIKKDKK